MNHVSFYTRNKTSDDAKLAAALIYHAQNNPADAHHALIMAADIHLPTVSASHTARKIVRRMMERYQ